MGAEHLRSRQLTCLLFTFVLSLRFDPVFGQNAGINWGAVGISWALSTVTTCLIIAAAFGIHACLKSRKNDTTDDEKSEHENGLRNPEPVNSRDQQRYVPSLDKPASGLLSVSQQSAYLRAQDGHRMNNRKRRSRTSCPEPHVYVEQWCEDQAKRPYVVAALQGANVDAAQNVNSGEENRSPYPAGLDLPNADVRSKSRNKREDPSLPKSRPMHEIQEESEFLLKSKRQKVDQNRRGAAQKSQNEAQDTDESRFPAQRLLKSAVLETAEQEKLQPENRKTASVSASKPQNVTLKADEIGDLKGSPVRIRKHAQKQTDLPPKTNVLEFKRAPGESNHVLTSRISNADRDDPVPKRLQQSDQRATNQSSNESSSSEEGDEEDEEEEEEDDEEEEETSVSSENPRPSQKAMAAVAVQKKMSRELFPPSDEHLESHKTANPIVESTPPNPSRSEAVRRVPRQSKPPVLNAVPIPAEGISPPPGLLPLTASSHRQVTRNQRQMAISQGSKEKIARDEKTAAARKQTSPKRGKAKGPPPSVDLKNKRSSTGSDIVFFAPELQGTSTPAMRPKSAFVPFSASMLSQDSADDNQDKLLKDVNIGLSKVANRSQTTPVSRNHQFHGLLSNTGLRHLAHAIHADWRHLAKNLHIPSDRQAFLVEKYSDSAEECTFEMLRTWRDQQLESRSNLRSLLCNALVAANHPEMAERLIQEEMIGSSEKLDGVKLVSVV